MRRSSESADDSGFLLLNHPLDCSICDQVAANATCKITPTSMAKLTADWMNPKSNAWISITIGDRSRCLPIVCDVYAMRSIHSRDSGTAELQVVSRGSIEEIDVFPDQPCNNKLAGNVVDLCPVGALCSKDFLYKKRVWWLKSQDSVCANCSTGWQHRSRPEREQSLSSKTSPESF